MNKNVQIVQLERIKQTKDSTLGILSFKDFQCYTLEDGYRETKVYGETRIPVGKYELGFRAEGGFYERYSKFYSSNHPMIQLLDVPNYEYVLIHKGNYVNNTAGCVLVGTGFFQAGNYFLTYSRLAYDKLRQILVPAMKYPTFINIIENFNE